MKPFVIYFISKLIHSTYFEDAAAETLKTLFLVVEDALSRSDYANNGRLLRGMIHLRPDGGYRGLVLLEIGVDRVSEVGGEQSLLPSLTAWRWVQQIREAVTVDVELGTGEPLRSGSNNPRWEFDKETPDFDVKKTQTRLKERDASHLCVLPLRLPGGKIGGMFSLEATCPQAMGKRFVWRDCGDMLQSIADIAAPHLSSLPRRPEIRISPDKNLPVVGDSMVGLVDTLKAFARQEETLLLYGPTGAGKSRLAPWCHYNSGRQRGPFVTVDLLSVPEELQQTGLFGWKTGAFTGAVSAGVGRVTKAEGGTLFIDEIDKLSPRAQMSLLRLIEERRYKVVGDEEDKKANVRFIIGTNADLHAEVRAGRFREDLFFRINVLPVRVPPLEDRVDEIAPWARYMAGRRHREQHEEGEVRLSAEAELVLSENRWPGNLRQLDNVVRRAYSLAAVEGDHGGDVFIRDRHVTQALGLEGTVAPQKTMLGILMSAAHVFVQLIERRHQSAEALGLDHSEGFKGAVLLAALERWGDLDTVYRRFGQVSLIENRNHRRAARRQFDRLDKLAKAAGEELSQEQRAIIDEYRGE